jgi:hypothetical protein
VTAVAAPGAPEDDEVVDRILCRCGALAPVVVQIDYDLVAVVIKCPCGWFEPADADAGSR